MRLSLARSFILTTLLFGATGCSNTRSTVSTYVKGVVSGDFEAASGAACEVSRTDISAESWNQFTLKNDIDKIDVSSLGFSRGSGDIASFRLRGIIRGNSVTMRFHLRMLKDVPCPNGINLLGDLRGFEPG